MSQSRPLRSVHTAEGWTPQTVADRAIPAMRSNFYKLDRSQDCYPGPHRGLRGIHEGQVMRRPGLAPADDQRYRRVTVPAVQDRPTVDRHEVAEL